MLRKRSTLLLRLLADVFVPLSVFHVFPRIRHSKSRLFMLFFHFGLMGRRIWWSKWWEEADHSANVEWCGRTNLRGHYRSLAHVSCLWAILYTYTKLTIRRKEVRFSSVAFHLNVCGKSFNGTGCITKWNSNIFETFETTSFEHQVASYDRTLLITETENLCTYH